MASNNFSISLTESVGKAPDIVSLTGYLTIENSNSIHDYLQRKALTKDIVTINLSNLDDIDLSILQLMVGFIRTRNELNKKTNIELNISDNLKDLVDKSGFTDLISSIQKMN
jgi:anti-anti-sigma regulatory factor